MEKKRFALGNLTHSVVHDVLRWLGQFSGRKYASVTKCELSHGVIGIDDKIIFEGSSVAWCCEQNLRTAILRTSVGRGSSQLLSHGFMAVDEMFISEVPFVACCCVKTFRTSELRISLGRGSSLLDFWNLNGFS